MFGVSFGYHSEIENEESRPCDLIGMIAFTPIFALGSHISRATDHAHWKGDF